MQILSVNVGSSSLKLDLWRAGEVAPRIRLEGREIGDRVGALVRDGQIVETRAFQDHETALDALLPHLPGPGGPDRVGHRVVHGGGRYRETVWVDAALLEELEALIPLSPVHLPPAIRVMRRCAQRLPSAPQAAVFDTAFHAGLPPRAATYAIPAAWRTLGVQRYGFHGIACADIVAQMGATLRRRAVILHLGAGCSATAVLDGKSVDTTMGLTPIEGLVMATRSGDLDPGALLYLQAARGLSLAALDHGLNWESGLLGLSGFSADMKTLLSRPERKEALFAIEVFCYRAAKAVAALAVALGGLEQLIFSGGIGEHAPAIRARIAAALHWLGMELDEAANSESRDVISSSGSQVGVYVVRVDEGREIARATAALPGGGEPG